MFLIFHLGRLDIWPILDLGVRRGWMRIHKMRSEISPDKLATQGQKFAGYESVVAWYCWRVVDN
jgi:DNA-3-methyladenine glycosylase II